MYKFITVDLWSTLIKAKPGNYKIIQDVICEAISITPSQYERAHSEIKYLYTKDPIGSVVYTEYGYYTKLYSVLDDFGIEYKHINVNQLRRSCIRVGVPSIQFEIASGCIDVLQKIKRSGISLSLVTNCGRFSASTLLLNNPDLRLSLLYDIFKPVFTVNVTESSKMGTAKPDKRMFKDALCTKYPNLGEEAYSQWLHIGDDFDNDITPVKELGGDAFLITDFNQDWKTEIPKLIWKDNA